MNKSALKVINCTLVNVRLYFFLTRSIAVRSHSHITHVCLYYTYVCSLVQPLSVVDSWQNMSSCCGNVGVFKVRNKRRYVLHAYTICYWYINL